MPIIVNEELKAYIDPLTPEEHAALERSLLAEGCRDALVLWGDVLVDGHNRYGICQKHGLPFNTVQHPHFRSMEDVHLWMIDQHLGRRSVSDFQRGVLALRKREILAQRVAATAPATAQDPEAAEAPDGSAPWEGPADAASAAPQDTAAAVPEAEPLKSREAIARAARLSSSQVVMIEKIQKQAAPELVAAVRSGAISINTAAAVATLPEEEQRAAAVAGKDELRQAAKRAREARRKPRAEIPQDGSAPEGSAGGSEPSVPQDDVEALRRRVAELSAENQALRGEVARLQALVGA
ncbi:plasmid replication/partition related protein [Paracidovorax avenae]|uniref:plasmid replication/partition related protein n=1 Tax=Paracidovorax avenae TaxID=80867 RepID=UPI000D171A04|nr:plasmid replication/partition related protein [Paracidovorax avenae]AVT00139.1 plasmid replication/partition related protein [Paracidovorax avenae]AVT07092.1 plasmid replication/partition related protein [Paracidovorax avenae]AVT17680.1 plasmid replication/partition related protein [Paracidovorax avenae]